MNSSILGRLPWPRRCNSPGTLEAIFPDHKQRVVRVLVKAHSDLWVFPTWNVREVSRALTTQTTCTSNWGSAGSIHCILKTLLANSFSTSTSLPHTCLWPLFPATFFHVYALLKIRSQSIQTNLLSDYSFEQSWSEVETYWLLSIWVDYTRRRSFGNAIQNHHAFVKIACNWVMFILVGHAITKQLLKEVSIRLKIPIFIRKESYS